MKPPSVTTKLALFALPLALAVFVASAASGRGPLVPGGEHSFPAWLSGPLHTLHLPRGRALYQTLIVLICGCYALILRAARDISERRLWQTIVVANVVVLLGPPLFSADVFGYIDFARLGVLHGLNPYTHAAASVPGDQMLLYVGWPHAHSPYGPLFTVFSYALVPLGIAGGLWAFKVIAVGAGLATTRLLCVGASRLGQPPRQALAFFGLNPLLLIFAVGGAHNDVLLGVFVTGALVATLYGRQSSALVVLSTALKASAALALPFTLVRDPRRARALLVAVGSAVALYLLTLIVFGTPTAALLDTLRGQQQSVAIHSLPSEVSRLLGLGRLAGGVRIAFLVGLILALASTLLRVVRKPQDWLEAYCWSVLALLAATAWLLPWYGIWALAPATLSESRKVRGVTLAACAYLIATRLPLTNPLLG